MPSARKAARVVPSPNVDNDPQRLGAKATVTPEAARRWMCQDKLERGKVCVLQSWDALAVAAAIKRMWWRTRCVWNLGTRVRAFGVSLCWFSWRQENKKVPTHLKKRALHPRLNPMRVPQ